MRRGPVVTLALALASAGCSFDGSQPPGDAGDDTPGVWRVDTEADFTTTGAWRTGAIATAEGALTVGRYFHGALAAAGRTGCGIGPGQQPTITWADVIAAPPVGRGYGVPNRPLTDGVVAGLGLAGDMFTAWWEGEIWLEAGTHMFHLLADDRAFVDVLRTDGWKRISAEGDATGDLLIPATGWYPIRIALAECGGEQALAIGHLAPGQVEEVPLSEARLRAVVNDAGGLVMSSFDDRANLNPMGMALATGPLVSTDWGDGRPPDLGLTDDETYSLRWTGQIRIDVAGDYSFHIHSDNGHRLRIDDIVELEFMSFGATVEDRTTSLITLAGGWHDLVLDFQEDTGAASVDFTVASGPELVGMTIPADRLRPMPGPSGRVVARTVNPDAAINDNATTVVPIRVEAPVGAVVDRVNFGYTIDHTHIGDLVILLRSPSGVTTTVRDRVNIGSPLTDRWIEATVFTGQDPSGVWALSVQDAASIDVGTVRQFSLTVHYRGGDAAQPAVATWESEVHALGAVRSIDQLQWTATTPGASTATLELRTCTAHDTCGDYAPVAASGDALAVPVAGFAQLRATLTPAGEDLPSIDAIELDYTP